MILVNEVFEYCWEFKDETTKFPGATISGLSTLSTLGPIEEKSASSPREMVLV